MLGIGLSELVLIALVAVVFIRPEDMPAVFRKLGKALGELRKIYAELTSTKDAFMRELDIQSALAESDRRDPTPSASNPGTQEGKSRDQVAGTTAESFATSSDPGIVTGNGSSEGPPDQPVPDQPYDPSLE